MDSRKNVFGGLMTYSFEFHENFFGTGESFLFKLKNGELYVYSATMLNTFYCFVDDDGFGLGTGNHYGLFIDKTLRHGSSHNCKTYNNDVLSDDNHFDIYNIEIWGFRE